VGAWLALAGALAAACQGGASAGNGETGRDGGLGQGDDAGLAHGDDQGSPSPTTITVTVSPATVSLNVGATAQFTATVAGTSNDAVTWTTSGGAISPSGLYTAPPLGGDYLVTATSAADGRAYGTAHAMVAGSSLSAPDPIDDHTITPSIKIRQPFQGMEFLAPATVTVIADSRDNVAPLQVQYMDGTAVAQTYTYVPDPNGGSADGYFLRGVLKGLPTGTHEIWVRETSADGSTHDSEHLTVTVLDPPVYSGQMALTGDLTLSGDLSLVGTTDHPFLLQANGHKIVAPSGWSGLLTIQNAHIRDLGADPSGDPTGTAVGMQVETTGGIDIENTLFEHCGSVLLTADGNAAVTVRGNTFNENTAVAVDNESNYYGLHPFLPMVGFSGSSQAPKVFAGNRVAMGFVDFENATAWTIGGKGDADTNLLMGPRGGIIMNGAGGAPGGNVYRGNFSLTNCPNRWTQCTNLGFETPSVGVLVEHNVMMGGWILRPFRGEARYNVIVSGGEAYLQSWYGGSSLHHNIITQLGLRAPGFCNNLFDAYDATAAGIEIFNNTWDGGGALLSLYGPAIRVRGGAVIHSIRSNAFDHFPYYLAPVTSGDRDMETQEGAQAIADYIDYNQFYNPERKTSQIASYFLTTTSGAAPGANGFGGHDVGGYDTEVDPKFAGASDPTAPEALGYFPFALGDIWSRKATASVMLQHFANYYRPDTGSPLVDVGDPQDGPGGDVGAVDTGQINPNYGRIDDYGP
jgi:hypothetical protein